MEEHEEYELVQRLHNTTDAQVWAKEFMALHGANPEEIDEGLMIGWFANAMWAAESATR